MVMKLKWNRYVYTNYVNRPVLLNFEPCSLEPSGFEHSTYVLFKKKTTNKQTKKKIGGGGLFELEWLSAFPLYSVNAH